MNKKVKNATPLLYDNIQFKSKIEVAAYKALKSEGFNPQYEKHTYEVWEGRKFNVPCYDVHNNRKLHHDTWELNSYKTQSIKYTPDFTFKVNNTLIIFEIKGHPNDRYPYIKKLFRAWLEENEPQSIFFEVHNQKQLKAAIEIIKQQSECVKN